jgi:UDP-glucose 4-epimerase
MGYRVRIFDKLYTSKHLISDIAKQVEIVEGDVAKSADVLRSLEKIDVAVHLIHTTVPGSSMQDPVYDVESNIVSCTRWLPYLKDTDLKRIIYISSGGTVYGVPRENPVSEDHPTEPICSYGITKLAIEKYIAMYSKLNGIEYRICRPANAYGEGQRLNIGQGVIGVFLQRALRREKIEIWGDGTNKRDYIYVEDLISAIVELFHHQGTERVFNISTAVGYSLNDVVAIMRDKIKIPITVDYKPSRGFDLPLNILDNSRLRRATEWAPKMNLEEGICCVYDWLKTSFHVDNKC